MVGETKLRSLRSSPLILIFAMQSRARAGEEASGNARAPEFEIPPLPYKKGGCGCGGACKYAGMKAASTRRRGSRKVCPAATSLISQRSEMTGRERGPRSLINLPVTVAPRLGGSGGASGNILPAILPELPQGAALSPGARPLFFSNNFVVMAEHVKVATVIRTVQNAGTR